MSALLFVGAPVVHPSVFGGWVIDDGSMPVHIADRRAAFAEAAARQIVPSTGDPLTLPGEQIATPGAAGSDPTVAASPAAGGWAPEPSATASPRGAGSGALDDSWTTTAVGVVAHANPFNRETVA